MVRSIPVCRFLLRDRKFFGVIFDEFIFILEMLFSSFIETGNKYKYVSVWDEPVGDSRPENEPLKFFIDVEAHSDCHVWLSDGEKSTRRGYEIVIGGWNNTRSEIRRGQQGTALACCLHKSSPLKIRGKSKFWIAIIEEKSDNSTTVVVGEGWELWKNKFLISVDKKPKLNIRSLSVSTGFGNSGKWGIFVGDEPDESSLSIPEVEKFEKNEKIIQPVVRKFPTTPIRETLVATGVSTAASSPGFLLKRPRLNFREFVEQDENSNTNSNMEIGDLETRQIRNSIDQTLAKFSGQNSRRVAEPQPPAKRRK